MPQLKTLVFLFLAPLALIAQQPAAIQGILTDASGAVIPGATVSLSGATMQKTTQTATDGFWSFAGLSPGDYTVKADYAGLEPFEKPITVEAGRTLQVPIQLTLRVSTQSVTVTGERGPELSLDPHESAVSMVVKDSDLDALPDDPDDLSDMLQALAGPASQAFGGAQILIDGFSGGKLPPKNTIKEIKINQNNFSADRDNQWSNGIEIITKPGADRLHGSAGLTDSNAVFNSRNPYSANKADYLNRMFTGNIGGSLNHQASYTFNVYRNTVNNTALINAVTLETPVRTTLVVPRDDTSGTGRLDYQISTNHTFTGSYRYLQSHRDNNGIGQYNLESRAYSSKNSTSEVHLRETAVLNSAMVTDTRFGYTRNGVYQYGDTATPSLVVAGSFNSGSAQTGRTSDVNSLFELQSNTTVTHKAQTIQFGGRLRHRAIQNISPSNFGGTFSFFGVTDAPVLDSHDQPLGNRTAQISSLEQYRRTLLFENLNYPATLIRSLGGGASQYSVAAGNPLVQFSQTDLGIYTQDDWRAWPNLTISLGLRYEIQTNIHDWRDFAPRVALAWSPGARTGTPPKTVFRAGWGMFYNRVDPILTQQALRFNGITQRQYVVQNPDSYPAAPALTSSSAATTYPLDPHLHATATSYTQAGIEQQLPGKTSVSVTYFNQRTVHLLQSVNINTPFPDNGLRPYGNAAGNIFQTESGGLQKVQWVDMHVNTKLNSKISFSSLYSLWTAHNNDDWNNRGTAPSNPYNFNADWGRAAWTGLQYFNFMGTVMAPWGFQFSPFLLAISGHPYNLTIGSDRNGDTIANDRPAFATDLSRPSAVVTRFGAFDTNPLPGQTIVPINYLTGAPIWNLNLRVSKTFAFGPSKDTPPQHRYSLNFNIDVNNILNHLNQGGYVGNLSSPQFGESTAIGLWSDTSNNRKVQLGTQFTF